ncbi:MAG: hypothetical protein ACRBCI_11740 [Cellvibrionaceae bacterium]
MQTIGEQLALIYFTILFAGFLLLPVTWLLLSIFTPQKLLEKYFKEPHFTLSETVLMAQFPGFLIRTAIFGWAILAPKLGKKRQIWNIKKFMPTWYFILLTLYMVGALFTLLALVTLLPILLLI